MIKKLSQRFDDLTEEALCIAATEVTKHGGYGNYDQVDEEMFDEWKVKAKSLIVKTCGNDSEHINAFAKAEEPITMDDSYSILKGLGQCLWPLKTTSRAAFLHQ